MSDTVKIYLENRFLGIFVFYGPNLRRFDLSKKTERKNNLISIFLLSGTLFDSSLQNVTMVIFFRIEVEEFTFEKNYWKNVDFRKISKSLSYWKI